MMPMEHSEDMESHRMMDSVFAELKAEAAALGADETVRGRRTGTALVAGGTDAILPRFGPIPAGQEHRHV